MNAATVGGATDRTMWVMVASSIVGTTTGFVVNLLYGWTGTACIAGAAALFALLLHAKERHTVTSERDLTEARAEELAEARADERRNPLPDRFHPGPRVGSVIVDDEWNAPRGWWQ